MIKELGSLGSRFGARPAGKSMVRVVLIFVVLIGLFWSVVIVPAGYRGVLLKWRAVSGRELEEGIHFIIPGYESIQKIDVRTQKLELEIIAYSRDIQTVDTKLALNYHVQPGVVGELWEEVGKDFEFRVIDPAINEAVKAATAHFTAQELIEQRPKVKEFIKLELEKRLDKYFKVDEFSIVDFSFSDAYERAIEAKQVAQQQALEQENITKQMEEKAKQRVIQAEAEARAIRIQAQALAQNKELIGLEWVKKWDGKLPQYVMGGNINALLNLPTLGK